MRARYYVPGVGRFASADTIVPDPTDPQSFNRYSYTRNSPTRYVDNSGHRECEVETSACDFAPPYNIVNYETPENILYIRIDLSIIDRYASTNPGVYFIPIHRDIPSSIDDLFPYEAAGIAAYFEHRRLHPNHPQYQHSPEERAWLEQYYVGDIIGIIQTMLNRSGGDLNSLVVIATEPVQYVWGTELDDEGQLYWPREEAGYVEDVFRDFIGISYAVLYLDIPDYIQGYQFFGHYNTSFVNGPGTDRAMFGPLTGVHPLTVPGINEVS